MKIRLVLSNNEESNQKALEMLTELKTIKRLGRVRIVPLAPEPFFEKRFDLPFAETGDGYRAFGLRGIENFVKRVKEGKIYKSGAERY